MLLKELFEENNKHVTFLFGRLNPPTRGHEQLLNTAASQGGDYKVFVSQSQDPKKNPLDYATKIKFIKMMFPEHAKNVVEDSSLNTIVKVASYLYDAGYKSATFVAGSDRLDDMKKLLEAYNGVEGKAHGFYKFEPLEFVSSGDREDGAEGVAGISASGARAAAANGDLDAFAEATGAGEYAEELYKAVRKGMGISETYSIDESVSVDAAVRGIVATGDSIAKTYGDLKTMAEKWVYNNGTLKGFHRNAAGVGKRWYDTFFWNKMENDLRTLLAKNPKAAAKIQDFLNIERDDKGHVSFNIIGRSLPRILNDVGEKMGDDDLKRFGANWFKRHKDYEDFLGRVEKEVNDDEDDDVAPAPKQPKDNVVGRQNAAAEDMVNQVLRSIDKKVAGEIRNAIAREPNKLQALQRELAKRNIKVGESTLEDIRKVKGGYRLVSKKSGRNLGTYPTKAGAEKRERQVQYFKHAGESIQEAPIEMDPEDPMDPMIYGHNKANPGKLKYRMARAAGQLKDLATRVDGASPEEWKRMAQQFEELKMNMEQIRHALEELGKIRKKGGIRSRGITV